MRITKVRVHHVREECEDDYPDHDWLQECLAHEDINWGDLVVYDKGAGYRMNGVYIVGKAGIMDLARKPDDYGSIPEEFHCPLFTPDAILEAGTGDDVFYWHNSLVPVKLSMFVFHDIEDIIALDYHSDYTSEPVRRWIEEKTIPTLVGTYQGDTYYFVVDDPSTFRIKYKNKIVYMNYVHDREASYKVNGSGFVLEEL